MFLTNTYCIWQCSSGNVWLRLPSSVQLPWFLSIVYHLCLPLELALRLLKFHACLASKFLAALRVSARGRGPGIKHLAVLLHLSILSIPGPTQIPCSTCTVFARALAYPLLSFAPRSLDFDVLSVAWDLNS